MTIELLSVFVQNEGKEVQLEIELRQGENSDRRIFKMPKSIFESIGVCEGEITRESMTEIMDADERYKALKRAFDII